ncbi:hypothetical protein M569_15382, partial [Genlisea aurea]
LIPSGRENWSKYFRRNGILFLFWSAKAASAALEGEKPDRSQDPADSYTKIYGRGELLARLQSEAEEVVVSGRSDPAKRPVVVGFVGYPNVGKSSTINALVGEKRTGVTSTPGKTKHFQTLVVSDGLTLCDCPGLVFPSFTSSRYDMIASGVLPIDRMTEHREAVQVVAERVPRSVIEGTYGIALPKPKPYEPRSRPPSASELLRAYCGSRGYVAAGGLPDETRAARTILKDYIDGKLLHYEMPPEEDDGDHDDDDDGDDVDDDDDDENGSGLDEEVMGDMRSFDVDNGLVVRKEVTRAKAEKGGAHKMHRKPPRKKDRSWRVKNGDGDGMPVVRVFRKPVNIRPSNV